MIDLDYYEIGHQFELEGNVEFAKSNYEKCLFGNYTAEQFCNIAVFLWNQNDIEKATVFIQRACELDDSNVHFQAIAGTLFGKTSEKSTAREHWERAHQLEPLDMDILYRLVAICFIQKDYPRILELLNPLLRTKERNPEGGFPIYAKPKNMEDEMIIHLSRELIDAYAALLRGCEERSKLNNGT